MRFECTPALADALAVIFKHEEIAYSHALGPGCICLETDKKDNRRVKTALFEWHEAVTSLFNQSLRIK
jgi:hypothetical protein